MGVQDGSKDEGSVVAEGTVRRVQWRVQCGGGHSVGQWWKERRGSGGMVQAEDLRVEWPLSGPANMQVPSSICSLDSARVCLLMPAVTGIAIRRRCAGAGGWAAGARCAVGCVRRATCTVLRSSYPGTLH